MDAAVSCSGALPQTNLSGSDLSRSDHKFPLGRSSCSYARSIGAVSCNKGLRIVPKKLEFLCSAASRDEERNEMVFGASHCEKKSPLGEALCVAAGVCTYGGTAVESHHSHIAEEKVGVLLLNLGGPETLDDVQPFLFNLFADPDIIRLPRAFRFLQKPLAKLISVLRAPKSKEGYASIGGGSPLRKITDEQANALKMALESKDMPVNVYVGMWYWFPFTEEAVHQLRDSTNTCNPLYDCNCFPVHFGAKTYCQGLTRKWPGG